MNRIDFEEIDDELFKIIIDTSILELIKNTFNVTEEEDIDEVDYQPVWTLNRETKEKQLAYVKIRCNIVPEFRKIHIADIDKAGASSLEMLEFLERNGGRKISATKR